MRAVAERVGVTPMALYPHVGSKAALLDGMVGRLLAGLLPRDAAAEPDAGWRERLGRLARAGAEMTRSHPWSAALLFARPSVTPEAVRAIDALYAALLDAGVPESQVPRVERLVSTFLLGYGASMAGGRFGTRTPDPRDTRGQLTGGALPARSRLAEWLDRPVDWEAEFEADLDDLGRLIESLARDRS